MLRRQVGEDAFWKGLSNYFSRYRNSNALTIDFQSVMEDAFGKSLGPFFQQWVYTPGQPSIKGGWRYVGGILTIDIHQAQAADVVYQTPLDIGIVKDRNAGPTIETVQLERRDQSFTIKLDREPAEVLLDPNVWLLMDLVEFVKRTR